MTAALKCIPAIVGDIVTITVPNWASAGFQWSAGFDDAVLEAVDYVTVAGDDTATAGDTRFQFKLLSAEAPLRLTLSRPGQSARQTRDYLIGPARRD